VTTQRTPNLVELVFADQATRVVVGADAIAVRNPCASENGIAPGVVERNSLRSSSSA
jgi:hypothetical protein